MKYKNFTLLMLAAMLFSNTFSQPTISKQRDFGGSEVNDFSCMDLTKDGGIILGGDSDSDSSGNKTHHNKGSYDYWVIKLDSLQHIQWDRTIGGESLDLLSSIQQTIDGGFILGGWSTSGRSGDKTQNGKGNIDYWIVKLNSIGDVEWDKTIGGAGLDELCSIQQTKDSGYILGGYSLSNISGNKTENSKGGYDYWIVKLTNSGHIQWDKTIGGKSDDILASVQQTQDGGYFLAGSSNSGISGDKTGHGKGSNDYWIVKLDNSGNVQWDKTIGGYRYDFLESSQQSSDSGFILGGYSKSDISGDKTENSKGNYDYWVVKINSLGIVEWDKTIGGSGDEHLYSIKQTLDNGYILGGTSYSGLSGDKTEEGRGLDDYWVVKLNKSGTIEWDKTIGGSEFENSGIIKERIKNHYVLGIDSESPISGDKTKNRKGSADYWLVNLEYSDKKNIITSSNKIGLQTTAISNNFSAYPNPVKDVLYVQSKIKASFSLTDQSGKTILTKTIEAMEK